MKRSGNNRGADAALGAVAGAMLLWLGNSAAVEAAAGAPRLSVNYEASKLSVEARGVSVTEILQAIGAKVGFAVVLAGAPRGMVTISLKDATLDTVLRQLLRPENYVLLYGEDRGGTVGTRIEKIVLLGPATLAPVSPEPVSPQQGTRGYEEIRLSPREPIVPLDLPRIEPPPAFSSGDVAPTPRWSGDEQRVTYGARGSSGKTPPTAGPPIPPNPLATNLSPPGAPDPNSVRQQILERVNALVDATRRATLDVPRGARHP